MLKIADYEFWFVAGSQFLYGEEQLKSVARMPKTLSIN